jgi:signal transduction histidine kinase
MLAVAVAFAAGGALFVWLLQAALLSSVESAAAGRAGEVGTQLADEGVAGLRADLLSRTRATQLVQVIDARGRVVASSSPAQRLPLTTALPAPGDIQRRSLPPYILLDVDDRTSLLVLGAAHAGQRYAVVVASSVEAEHESVRAVLIALAVGLPVLVALVGVITWWLTGQALDPVERLRRRVEGITAAQLNERVPVPPTKDELARLAATMNELLDRLEVAQTQQRRFIADASHELRSPLSTVLASLELAGDGDDGLSWTQLQPLMTAEAMRMSRLVENLLVLARADERGMPLRYAEVDVDDLVRGEAARLRASTELALTLELAPVRIHADEARLVQVMRNLVDNAAREARSRVALSVAGSGDAVRIEVADDGAGIEPADRQRVFDRFVRLDSIRDRSVGGSGLGLAIVREIVRAHHGNVWVLTSRWGGACFRVELPLQPATADADPTATGITGAVG